MVLMTSNKEREFPEPFLRRCITIELTKPSKVKLTEIVKRHFGGEISNDSEVGQLIQKFTIEASKKHIATDRLLNAIHVFKEFYKLKKFDSLPKGNLVEKILGIIN